MGKKRILGIDIAKTISIIFVILLHQMSLTQSMAVSMNSASSFLMAALRYLLLSGVPVFLITTGFLQNKKNVSKEFYIGLAPILVSYILCASLSVIANVIMDGEEYNPGKIIMRIIDFTENDYAWYVEMYIGLYLLIPFLNSAYGAIENKRKKQLLIGIMLILTALPSVSTMFGSEKEPVNIFIDHWMFLYPFTYYFIGAYISEYRPKFNVWILFSIILAMLVTDAIAEALNVGGGMFDGYVMSGFQSLSCAVISVCLFLAVYRRTVRNKIIKFILMDISTLTLEIYLLSYIFEKFVYPTLYNVNENMLIMFLVIFILSFFAAHFVRAVKCLLIK